MREILFKGKRKDNGEWVEGSLTTSVFFTNDGNDVPYILNVDGVNYDCFEDLSDDEGQGYYEVDPETVCQYTSMKDANGNKIWENDIVKSGEDYGAVEWDEASFVVDFDGWRSNLDAFWGSELEVIGNKFDDPELLEGDK